MTGLKYRGRLVSSEDILRYRDLIAQGFSAIGWTDHEILAREFIVYDALYAECRRRVETESRGG